MNILFSKDKIEKKIFVIISFTAVVLFSLFFCLKKQGLFFDEIYQYVSTNSHLGHYLTDYADIVEDGKIITQSDCIDYIAYSENDKFSLKDISDRVANSAEGKPPFYHYFTAIGSSLTLGKFSIWSGLFPNIIIYILTNIFLYLTSKNITNKQGLAAVSVILYGMSSIGISNLVFIRMYMLLTFWTVFLTWVVERIMNRPKKMKYHIMFVLAIFGGAYTQYIYIYYAAILCFIYVIYGLYKKRIFETIRFIVDGILGLTLVIILYPQYISFAIRNSEVYSFNIIDSITRLPSFIVSYASGLFVPVIFSVVSIIGIIVKHRTVKNNIIKINIYTYMVIISCVLSFLIVVLRAPYSERRYAYHLAPIFVFIAVILWKLFQDTMVQYKCNKIYDIAFVVMLIALSAVSTLFLRPEWLYENAKEIECIIDENKDSLCIYMIDEDVYQGPLIQDVLQLAKFREVYVTNNPNSEFLINYINDCEYKSVVLYVASEDCFSYTVSDTIGSILSNTKMNQCDFMYQYTSRSKTFLLKE